MRALVIARLTFHEARRSKILFAAVFLSIVFLLVYGIGFNIIQDDVRNQARGGRGVGLLEMNEIFNFLTLAGLYVVNFLSVMMSVLTSVGTLSGEIASGTVHSLVSKPIQRWEVVLGKWLGFAVMLTLYLLLLSGGVLLLVRLIADYTAPNPLKGIFFLWLNAMMLLSVSLLGGASVSTLTNGVLVFGLFGVSFVGGWIEQIGSFLENQTAVNIGIISSLILPSEALWKRVAYEMQSPLVSAFGGFSPFSAGSVPSDFMLGYTILYALAALILAVRVFQRRDL